MLMLMKMKMEMKISMLMSMSMSMLISHQSLRYFSSASKKRDWEGDEKIKKREKEMRGWEDEKKKIFLENELCGCIFT